jgi:hypothetical protein
MEAFSEIEQRTLDLDWYALDQDGRIGQFLTGGKLLPGLLASDRVALEQLSNYFEELSAIGGFLFCPDFNAKSKRRFRDPDAKTWMPFSQEMSSRGLYSYDSEPGAESYIRVSVPTVELTIGDLPPQIAAQINRVILPDFSFVRDRVIPDDALRELLLLL